MTASRRLGRGFTRRRFVAASGLFWLARRVSGHAVALSRDGTTGIVGATGDGGGSGAAYVFERVDGN